MRAVQPNVYRLLTEALNVWVADVSAVQPLTTGGYVIIPSPSRCVDEATFSLGGILFRTTSVDYILIVARSKNLLSGGETQEDVVKLLRHLSVSGTGQSRGCSLAKRR